MKHNRLGVWWYAILLFLSWPFPLCGQEEAVAMRVGGREVTIGELEYAFRRYAPVGKDGKKMGLEAYAHRYADRKLEVLAAEEAGADTLPLFRSLLDKHRWQTLRMALTDGSAAEQRARQEYERLKAQRHTGRLRVSEIFRPLPQRVTTTVLRREEALMDSLYTALRQGASFEVCVERFSDRREAFDVERLEMPVEFEDTVFALRVGEFSPPFFTPEGLHIVKLLERRELPPFEAMKEEIVGRQARSYATDAGSRARVEALKRGGGYREEKAGVDEWLSTGATERALFTFDGRTYTGRGLARFAAAHPGGRRKQLEGFIAKSLLDRAASEWVQSIPTEERWRWQLYRDSLLLAVAASHSVAAAEQPDEAALQAFFEKHRSDYDWETPRYRGAVLHCTTKRVAKQARKLLKSLPYEEWSNAVRLMLNAGPEKQVRMEQGTFAPGDNAWIDARIFRCGKADPDPDFPFTAFVGGKRRGPEHYDEVGERLLADYERWLQEHRVSRLRAVVKVEINQEVLKSVNKHRGN